MKNTYYRTCNMASKTETWKMRNAYCRTWNMAINLENEKKNEKIPRYDLEYGEKD